MRGTVRLATSEAERERIYRLRYDIYIEEMKGQQRHVEADCARRRFADEWDARASHFYVEQDEALLACARLTFRRDGPFECEREFELPRFMPDFPDRVSMSSRLALHPKLRGSHVLKQLTCAMFAHARDRKVRFDFIDCHPRLLPLYSRLGYRIYRPGFNHPKYTYVVPMVLVLDDCEYLEKIGSPFAVVAQDYPRSTEGTELLLERFQDVATEVQPAVCDAEEFWDLFKCRLLALDRPDGTVDILDRLNEEEMKLVISAGHVVSCREGDVVLCVNDPGRELFVILSGIFEVSGTIDGPFGPVGVWKLLRAGDTFGEIRFLTEHIRYASVTARSDARVLVLNSKALDRLMTGAPRVAAKLYRNLARLVVSRLQELAL
ncbi:cyclic nucleotide-binding domain-containing protein [Candidatus Nitrospira bockiana]